MVSLDSDHKADLQFHSPISLWFIGGGMVGRVHEGEELKGVVVLAVDDRVEGAVGAALDSAAWGECGVDWRANGRPYKEFANRSLDGAVASTFTEFRTEEIEGLDDVDAFRVVAEDDEGPWRRSAARDDSDLGDVALVDQAELRGGLEPGDFGGEGYAKCGVGDASDQVVDVRHAGLLFAGAEPPRSLSVDAAARAGTRPDLHNVVNSWLPDLRYGARGGRRVGTTSVRWNGAEGGFLMERAPLASIQSAASWMD